MKKKDFKAFQSNFLAKEDLPAPRILTIKSVEEEEIKGEHGQEAKPVMSFRGFDKLFILNNINYDVIANFYGDDTDDWIGKPIEVFVDPNVMFGKERVGGVRVRQPNGQMSSAPAQSFAEPEMWTLEQASAACIAVGITKPELIAHLKAQGNTSFKPDRDTAVVKALIASRQQKETTFEDLPSAEMEQAL